MFENFARLGEPHARRKGHYRLQKLTNFNSLLGEDWLIRVTNQAGDFAYIIKGTVQFHLLERAPLEQFKLCENSLKPKKNFIHRGFSFVFLVCQRQRKLETVAMCAHLMSDDDDDAEELRQGVDDKTYEQALIA